MEMRDFVVRFAGEGGQGVVTSAEGLAQTATQAGYHALTFATFPSQILGGPTWTQTRISNVPVLSSGDDLDVLVLDGLRHEPHTKHLTLHDAVEIAGKIGAKQTYFVHMAHSILHEEEDAQLPECMNLGYDGLTFNARLS